MPAYTQVPTEELTDCSVCQECGVVVYQEITHTLFHEDIDKIAKTARDADQTAGLFRPIG